MNSRSDAARYAGYVLGVAVLEAALLALPCGVPHSAAAEDEQMEQFKDVDRGSQPTPPVTPRFEIDPEPSGMVGPTVRRSLTTMHSFRIPFP